MKKFHKFLLLFLLSFVAYSLGLWALNLYYHKGSPFRYLLVLLPMLPAYYVVFISVRGISQCDEMIKRIATEGMAFSALATALTCLAYSFCHDMGAPEFKAYWAWSLVSLYYIAGVAWAKRRYR
jgi:hypothetical protein